MSRDDDYDYGMKDMGLGNDVSSKNRPGKDVDKNRLIVDDFICLDVDSILKRKDTRDYLEHLGSAIHFLVDKIKEEINSHKTGFIDEERLSIRNCLGKLKNLRAVMRSRSTFNSGLTLVEKTIVEIEKIENHLQSGKKIR